METTNERLMHDLKAVAGDVEELLKATAGQTGDKIAAARARAEESLRGAKDRIQAAGEEVSARTRQAMAATDDYVHHKPWVAVGIASGVGFLVGYLLGRR